MTYGLFTQGTGAFPTPRDFQLTAHELLRQGFAAGHHKQLLVAPTGAGKTYLGLRVGNEALLKGRRANFVCDRIALIDQTSTKADEYGLTDHGIVQAEHWRHDLSRPLQICSIQTIAGRVKYGHRQPWPESHVLVIDEAHTQHSTWVDYVANYKGAVVGLTATPCSPGLGKIFSNMVNAATMDELTRSGVLVPMRILSCTKPDMTGAATSGGEWTDKAASEREAMIIGDVVGEWVKHGEMRKTIAFGPDIAYCEDLAARFNQAGIAADCFTSRTTDSERKRLLSEFSKPESCPRILISVEALAKGFDVQDIGCVIDARPLRKSLSTAIQMWGRGLRSAPGTFKKDCLLLDHSGNILRFLKDFENIYFNGFKDLSTAEKCDSTVRKDPENDKLPCCPKCGAEGFYSRCRACGYEKPTMVLEDSTGGEMREIRIGKKVIASDASNLYQQICTYVRSAGNPETQRARAYHLFKDITGYPPPRGMSFDGTAGAPVSHGTLGKIKQLRIAFAKRPGRNQAA